VPQLARRAVKNGVDDNLVTLKETLEKHRFTNPEQQGGEK